MGKNIAELREYVATIDVVVSVDGAVISVDDAVYGKSPLPAPITVNAGRRKFRAELDGRVATKALTIAGGDNDTISLELPLTKTKPTPDPGEPTPVPDPRPDEPSGSTPVWVWIGFGATALFAIAAGVTGGIALSESGKLEDERFAGQVPKDVEKRSDRVQNLAIATDVLAITAGATLAATVIAWLILGNDPPEDAKPTASTGIRISGTPGWGVGLTVTY